MKLKILAAIVLGTINLTGGEIDDSLTPFLHYEVSTGKIAGIHAEIYRNGKEVYSERIGYSNIEEKRPISENSIYRLASMTKIVTAMAALQLWEEGKFKLDDPVSFHLPYFKNVSVLEAPGDFEPPYETVSYRREPTIRDLFRHTSGIWGGQRYTIAGLRNWDGSLDGFVERLVSVPLDSQPGSKFQYGYSLDVIGLLIEKWSGQTLDDYFQQHIFEPLGLKDTGFEIPTEKRDRLTCHYAYQDGQLVLRESPENSPFRFKAKALSGGGGWDYSYPGLTTTVSDWMTIMETLRNYGESHGKRL